jgi:hypothetical protein
MARHVRFYQIVGLVVFLSLVTLHLVYRSSNLRFDFDRFRPAQGSLTDIVTVHQAAATASKVAPLASAATAVVEGDQTAEKLKEEQQLKEEAQRQQEFAQKIKQAGERLEELKQNLEDQDKADQERAEKERLEREKAEQEKAEQEQLQQDNGDQQTEGENGESQPERHPEPSKFENPEQTLEDTLHPQEDPWEQSVKVEVDKLEAFLKNQREKSDIDAKNDEKTEEYVRPIVFSEEDYVDGKLQPTGSDIVLISASDNNGNRTKLSMAMQNRNEYAKKWGYRSYFVDLEKFKGGTTDSGKWLKVAAIKEVYENVKDAKWYFWLDSDIIIMNPSMDMASHCLHPKALAERIMYGTSVQGLHREPLITYPDRESIDLDNIDIVLSKDKYSIQTGALFFRRSEFTTLFLEIWDDPAFVKMNFQENEQDALLYLALKHPSLFKHLGLIQQRMLNPYPAYHRSQTGTWEENDFMVHFPGDAKHDESYYTPIWAEFWDKRQRVEEEYQMPYKLY